MALEVGYSVQVAEPGVEVGFGLGARRIEVQLELKELALALRRIVVSQDHSNLFLIASLCCVGNIGYRELCSILHQTLVIDALRVVAFELSVEFVEQDYKAKKIKKGSITYIF